MPRKKTVPTDELPNEGLPTVETGGEESADLPSEGAPAAEDFAYGEGAGTDTPGSDANPPPMMFPMVTLPGTHMMARRPPRMAFRWRKITPSPL